MHDTDSSPAQATPGAPSTSEEGVRAQPWSFSADVHGYYWPSTTPLATVMLQHGFNEYSERYVAGYSQLIPTLLSAGFAVRAFDLRGHGRSAGRRADVDVHVAVQDHLTARRALGDVGPLVLMGHSLGGLVTATSAARDPRGISAVVLMSAALPFFEPWPRRALARVLRAVAPTAPAPVPPLPSSGLSRVPGFAEKFANDPRCGAGRINNRMASTALECASVVRAALPTTVTSTLVMHGSSDLQTDVRGSAYLFDLLAATDKTLHVVEGGYHELLHDVDATQTMNQLMSWLKVRFAPH